MRNRTVFLRAAVLGILAAAEVNAYAGGITAFRREQEREIEAHVAQQQEDEVRFRESLKGMSPAEKALAIAEHRAGRKSKNDAFSEKLRRDNVAYLKARLLKTSRLTEAEKEELIAFFERQSSEDAVFRKQRYDKNVAFFEKTANDPSLSLAQKKDRIREYFEARRSENWREAGPAPDRR